MKRIVLAIASIVVLVLVGCGGGDDDATNGGTTGAGNDAPVEAPEDIVGDGNLSVCVDASYPPAEFFEDDGVTHTGFDIDMAKGIAERFGVEAQFVNTKFDAIIPALQGKKCDVIISALTNNEERREEIDFVNYVDVGGTFLVEPGNPQSIHGIEDLCGKNVAMIIGENWKPFLEEQDAACKEKGEAGVRISEYNTSSDELRQLRLGRVDAIVTNTLNGAWLVQETEGQVELADGATFTENPMGIGVRKGEEELQRALTEGVQDLYDSGEMEDIFASYGMSDAFLEHRPE